MIPLEITPREVKERLDRGEKLRLVDVREPHEFQQAHIDGSELIPMRTVPQHLPSLEAEEAPLRRLATLKQYGLGQVPYGTPDMWRAKIASVLEGFVTLNTFPDWINDVEAHRIIRGKVDEVLQPFQEEVARKKEDQARKEHEAQDERRVQQLIEYGKLHASSEIPFGWDSDDRDRAAREVERMLKESVEADWNEEDVKDAVNDELDEWEDENIEEEYDDEEDKS